MSQKKIMGRGFVKAPQKPLIPEGEYEGRIVKADICFAFCPKVLIQLRVNREKEEIFLPMFCNVTVNESQQMLEPGRSSKLGKIFRRLLPNTPFAKITLDSIIGLNCLIRIKTSKADADRKDKPKEDWYSVVHEVIEVIEPESLDDDIPF
jgi:hypothetical protein